MKTRASGFAFGWVAAMALAACGSSTEANEGTGNASTFPATPLLSSASDSGALHFDLRTSPAQPPTRGLQSVELVLTNTKTSAPASGLALEIVPWMPAMGHGTSITPSVAETSPGTYLVSDVDLFMSGTWELRTTVTGVTGVTADTFSPQFDVP